MKIENEYVLEWSQQQGFFHIETITEMINRNRDSYNLHRVVEYAPVAIGLTHKEAQKLSEQMESHRPVTKERAAELFRAMRGGL